ncbi:MAG: glutaredoxin 3 [Alphaproteobacteria bacterium]|nr:MAG: glutaredoxin 3 [Alphaproteobacteria bacterium]
MTNIIMYKTPICPYCTKAKGLLQRKGITNITEIDISTSDALREEMLTRSGGRKTVPQIFIGSTHVGGCDDLYELDRQGELDKLLAG